jgi:hypothetical protein
VRTYTRIWLRVSRGGANPERVAALYLGGAVVGAAIGMALWH